MSNCPLSLNSSYQMKTEANGGSVPIAVQEHVNRIKSICQLPHRSIVISDIKSAQVFLIIAIKVECGSSMIW